MTAIGELVEAREVYMSLGGAKPMVGSDTASWYWKRSVELLRGRVSSLQARGTELVLKNQQLRHEQLVIEELRRVTMQLTERLALAERVALKLYNEEELNESECYVLEAIRRSEPTSGARK